MFQKDAKLNEILHAPSLSVSDKQQIVQELQKHIGSADKEGIVKNLLNTLAENNRLSVLKGVVEKFGVLMGAHRGEVELTVTSAAVRIEFLDIGECSKNSRMMRAGAEGERNGVLMRYND